MFNGDGVLDIIAKNIGVIAQISREVADHPLLQARLADLAWTLSRPRSPDHATLAIAAYRKISISSETWRREIALSCWERALVLARCLNLPEQCEEIEAELTEAFHQATRDDRFLVLDISKLLASYRLGKGEGIAIPEKLHRLATTFEEHDPYLARTLLDQASIWFRRCGDEARATEMIVDIAESWASQAARVDKQLSAAAYYQSAILTYRKVPRKLRKDKCLDKRIGELQMKLDDAEARSVDELKTISSPPIDVASAVKEAKKWVEGKETREALLAFITIFPGFDPGRLREEAKTNLNQSPWRSLFPETYLALGGRPIAKPSGEDEVLWAEMIKLWEIELRVAVAGLIIPAFQVITREHRLCQSDFIEIAAHSPIVPPGRALLFGKGLFAGYDEDFATALHLLVPQIEHMVRSHLKQEGVATIFRDDDGLATENGLTSLLNLPQVAQILGENTAFEIKALFCGPLPPNLRNEIAHGLIDDDHCSTLFGFYAWWFALKLVLSTLWNRSSPSC